MTKYVNNNGVSEMWLNIKNWVTSQLLGYSQTGHTHTKSQITDLDLSNFVDKTSNQTISGPKTFTSVPSVKKDSAGDLLYLIDDTINTSNEDENGFPLTGHTNSLKIRGHDGNMLPCMLTGQVFTNGDTSAELRAYKYKDISSSNSRAILSLRYIYNSNYGIATFSNVSIVTPNVTNTANLGSPPLQWNTTYTRNILIDNDINIASSMINKTSTSGNLAIRSGPYYADGASINLKGKDQTDASGGRAYITANDGTNRTELVIYPTGETKLTINDTTKNLALQEDVVDLTSNQTISGNKKFTNTVTIEKSSGDTELLVKNAAVDATSITTNAMDDIRFVDQNNNITGGLRISYETNGSISTTMYARSYSQDGLTYVNKVFTITSNIQTGIFNSRLSTDFVPDTNNIYNLGSSSLQWNSTYTRHILIDNDINIWSSVINKTSTSGSLSLRGGTNYADGASIGLYGKDYNGGYAGAVTIIAYGNSDYTNLYLYPNGTVSVYNNSTGTTKNVAMQEDTIPRNGGAVITNYFLGRSENTGSLMLSGGTSWSSGGSLETFGSGHSSYAGQVRLQPALSDSNFKTMTLAPNGTWTWGGTACQIISDQRYKQQIAEIDDKLLDAWEDVNLVQFKYNDAVKEKSDNARLHTGYVVQQIDKACKSHGVDISAYGLYCHEEYSEETEEVEVEQADGTKVKEKKVICEASEHYSLRYTEVYAVECMYLRRCIARLTARIEELEKGNNSK